MRILGIESSCDDTSVALIEANEASMTILKEKTASQIEVHKKYGGVVPEIAGRCHAEQISPLIEAVMEEQEKPDAIAVTAGPGLITGLLVGVEAAKTLSYLWQVPLVPVNHIEGHIHSVEIKNQKSKIKNTIEFPALCLVVSGGHTELIVMKDHGVYTRIGATRDDAAGECFDKVAKLLGFEYPGGPKISAFAETGNTHAITFPRPMMHEKNYEFSFAGLKTAALYWLRDHKLIESGITVNDFCASFEQAIVDVIIHKTMNAAKEYQPKTIILCGGVSANKKLREDLQKNISTQFPHSAFLIPDSNHCMDNGAMIAAAGYFHAIKHEYVDWRKIVVDPNWRIA